MRYRTQTIKKGVSVGKFFSVVSAGVNEISQRPNGRISEPVGDISVVGDLKTRRQKMRAELAIVKKILILFYRNQIKRTFDNRENERFLNLSTVSLFVFNRWRENTGFYSLALVSLFTLIIYIRLTIFCFSPIVAENFRAR